MRDEKRRSDSQPQLLEKAVHAVRPLPEQDTEEEEEEDGQRMSAWG